MKGFLDSDQIFIKGQYKGDSLEAVVMDDPDYVKFLVNKHDLNDEEAEIMKEALREFRGK